MYPTEFSPIEMPLFLAVLISFFLIQPVELPQIPIPFPYGYFVYVVHVVLRQRW